MTIGSGSFCNFICDDMVKNYLSKKLLAVTIDNSLHFKGNISNIFDHEQWINMKTVSSLLHLSINNLVLIKYLTWLEWVSFLSFTLQL